jgi:indolepyruvate ferredoxin oxidoreductase
MTFGGWMMSGFSGLARLKSLRGTAFDIFGYTQERKRERALRDRYMAFARELVTGLRADNKEAALTLAQLPDQVRGYGHIKLAALDVFDARWAEQLPRFHAVRVIELKRQA